MIYRYANNRNNQMIFNSWNDSTHSSNEKGWLPKEVQTWTDDDTKNSLLEQTGKIISVFIENGQWILIPVVILSLILGMIFFFLETSVLAPFIYTLF